MSNVSVTQKDSIVDQLNQSRRRIEQRAYDLFLRRDGAPGDALADWLAAEQQTLWKPAVELREKDGVFTVLAALTGVDPKDVSVDVSAEDVVIKGRTTCTRSTNEGPVPRTEFSAGELFESVHFPKAVDSAKARAECRNGLLTITVPVGAASAAPPKAVTIRAA